MKREMGCVLLIAALALAACGGKQGGTGSEAAGGGPGGAPGGLDQGAGPTTLPGGGGQPGAGQGGVATAQSAQAGPGQGVTAQAVQPTTAAPPTAPALPTEVALDARGGSAESLQGAWDQAYELPPGVPFAISTTEAEIEAMITQKLAASSAASAISNVKVRLDNGQITVSFTLTISQQNARQPVNVSADGSVVFAAAIDAQGQLALTVVSANFGKLSLPPDLLAPLNEAVTQALTGAASGAEAQVTLTSLVIDDGVMTVKGYVAK